MTAPVPTPSLTDADRALLMDAVAGSIDDFGWCQTELNAVVEAIVARAVAEALTEVAEKLPDLLCAHKHGLVSGPACDFCVRAATRRARIPT